MQKFVIINNDGIMINVGVNLKNSLIKEDLIKILIGILVTVNASVINHEILENIKTLKSVNGEYNKEIDGNEMIYNDYENACNSSTRYIVLFVIFNNDRQ